MRMLRTKNILIIAFTAIFAVLNFSCNQTSDEVLTWNPDKENLPQPFLQEHPGWVDLYKRAFEIAFLKVQHGTPENGFVENYVDEAFSDKIFQWDTNFMMMFGRYSNGELPSIISLDNFYMAQDEEGWIGRELLESDGSSLWPEDASGSVKAQCSINPPLFSWSEWQNFLVSGDAERFTKKINGKPILQVLVDYFYWIKKNRTWENGLYWTTPFANGMDDSPRLFPEGVPNWDWGGDFADICSHQDAAWIDISAQQAMNAYFIGKIAKQVGQAELAEEMKREHAELSDLINKLMWDDKDGFYYDLDRDGELFKVKTPASFWPMAALVSSEEQTKRLVEEHILNPNEFWTQHHIPTVAFNEPLYKKDGGYWCGSIWAPTTYETIKGLEEQGYAELAHKVAYNHIQNLYWVYRETNTLWENYQPSNTKEGGHARPDFVGWTGCGPIATLIENIMGIHLNAPDNSITWELFLTEEHGINNLNFGSNNINLKCSDRSTEADGVEITVESKEAFDLTLVLNGKVQKQQVKKGSNTITIGVVEKDLLTINTQSLSLLADGFGNKDKPRLTQTFVGVNGSELKAIDVKIKRNGNLLQQSNLVVEIFEINDNQLGESLATSEVSTGSIDNFYEIVNIPIHFNGIEADKNYAVVLSQKNPSKEDYSWIVDENSNYWMKAYFVK